MAHTVVVGAGIAGACVAFGLVRRGEVVTVVDDARDGRATAAGAGIIQPWASAASGPYYELYARGAAHYPEFVAELAALGSTELGYRRSGSLVVSTAGRDIDTVEDRLRGRRSAAPAMGDVERLDGAELQQLFPPLRDGSRGCGCLAAPAWTGGCSPPASWPPSSGWAATSCTARSPCTASGAASSPTSMGGPSAVTGSSSRAGRGRRPCSPRSVTPWTSSRSAARSPTSAWEASTRMDGPTVVHVGDHYLVAFDRGRIVVGATRETGSGFDVRVTAAGQRDVLEHALTLAPGLAAATVLETRVGLRPLAPGGVPSVGPVPGLDDVYVATGYGAAGLTMAPALGDALAGLIVSGTAPFELPPLPG